MNIATSFAIKEKKVIAIDLDMRRASLSEFVNKPKLGISDYLNGRVADWHAVKYDLENYSNIEMIPVGTIPPNPAELLFSDRLQKLLDELREQYDLIFLDCPPVEMVADPSIINRYADLTVFVVRAGVMEKSLLPEIDAWYTEHKFNNMVLFLNGTDTKSGRYGYLRYGYHRYGYSYYGSSKK
jgi:capsular exopolysaccharide synthesis family protein